MNQEKKVENISKSQTASIEASSNGAPAKRTRRTRSFPASTFEEALELAAAIQQAAGGQVKIRRLTLFDHMGKSPDSGPSRQLITNASKYKLIKGNYNSEFLELTPEGNTASNPEVPAKDRLRSQFRLAIEQIQPFKGLYDKLKGNKLPSQAVLRDVAQEFAVDDDNTTECVDTFILNVKFLGVLKTVAGAERLITLEHALDSLPVGREATAEQKNTLGGQMRTSIPLTSETDGWDKICFYITPIGDEDSEERQHSDLFLNSLVEPAIERFGFKVIRADHIGKPGMISSQVIEHVLRARLVIADLSFHNPNVFYELCLRHVTGLPVVQLIRKVDKIPFDLEQFRTITIDTTNIYTLVPHLETLKSEIANQTKRTLEAEGPVDNPLTVFFPGLSLSFGGGLETTFSNAGLSLASDQAFPPQALDPGLLAIAKKV